MVASFGPCEDWPVTWVCDISAASPALTGAAVSMATEALWAMTGMRFGLCSVTLRPCRSECLPDAVGGWSSWPWSGYYPQPALIGGAWFNLVCGGCPGECSCTSVPEFVLPAPVAEIVQIKIDGVVLAASAYRLDNNRIVVRTDGEEWPRCNDLSLGDTAEGTWSVTAKYGQALPEGAALAVGALACEIVRAGQGEDCNLPAGLTQLIRQGVTIQYPNLGELIRQGRTGLYLADLFINTWNPHGLRQRSRTYNVERPTVRRPNT